MKWYMVQYKDETGETIRRLMKKEGLTYLTGVLADSMHFFRLRVTSLNDCAEGVAWEINGCNCCNCLVALEPTTLTGCIYYCDMNNDIVSFATYEGLKEHLNDKGYTPPITWLNTEG